jgi:DNA polymerase III delta subunit
MCTLISEIEKLCAYASRKNLPCVYNEDIDFVCIRNTAAKIDDVAKGVVEGNYSSAISALYRLKNEEETYIFGAVSKKISELCTVDHYKNKGFSMQEIAAKTGMRDFVVKNNFRYLSDLYAKSSKAAGNPCDRLVKILSEYDIKLKSYPTNKFLLLENMVFKLCKR